MKLAGCLLFACGALLSQQAQAQPSLWQRAKDPNSARSYAALVRVERMLEAAHSEPYEPVLLREFSLGALAMLELSGTTPSEPRLEQLVASALIDSGSGRDQEAAELIERALAADPDSPLAGEGLLNLALIAARSGDVARERAAYASALKLIWQPERRARIYLNLADADMSAGDLSRSIAGYRLAIQFGTALELHALAHYGLAVALERNGDLPAALAAATLANALRLPPGLYPTSNALDLPEVFFLPAYELAYYKALAALAEAREARDPELHRARLSESVEYWQAYLDSAELDQTPWVPNARRLKLRAERELAQARSTPPLRPAAR